MADLSLDEIIATKKGLNFKVKFSNQKAGKQFQEKSGQQGLQRKGFRLNRLGAAGQKRAFSSGGLTSKTARNNGTSLAGPGKGQIDARDMITIKNRIKMPDARVKIVQKRINKRTFDARSKLQPKSQLQAGTRPQGLAATAQQQQMGFQGSRQPVRSPTQQGFQQTQQIGVQFQRQTPHFSQPQPTQMMLAAQNFTQTSLFKQSYGRNDSDLVNFTVAFDAGKPPAAPIGPLTRTLVNPLASGGAMVEDTGSSLKITRTIPDVTFDGQNLTVTRRLPKGSRDQDPPVSSSRSGGSRTRMDSARGPVIQFQNDRFQTSPSPTSAPVSKARSRGGSSQGKQRTKAPSPIYAPVSSIAPVKSPSPVQTSSKPPSASLEHAANKHYKTGGSIPVSNPTPKAQEPEPRSQGRIKPPPSGPVSTVPSKRLSLSSLSNAQRETHSPPVSSRLSSSGVPASKRLAPRPAAQSHHVEETRVSAASKSLKRRAPMTLSDRFAAGGANNPIQIGADQVPVKKRRLPEPEAVKEEDEEDLEVKEITDSEEEEESGVTLLSPLQGFRILVSNLHVTVTQDDIIELFGAIGPLKRANLLTRGQAEVAFIHKDHAVIALKKYHNRELDGQPMFVKLMTPLNAKVMKTPASEDKSPGLPPSLRSTKKAPASSSAPVEIPLIHKALFKTGSDPGPSKSVRFTVKL